VGVLIRTRSSSKRTNHTILGLGVRFVRLKTRLRGMQSALSPERSLRRKADVLQGKKNKRRAELESNSGDIARD